MTDLVLQVLIGIVKTPAATESAAGVRPQGARNADSLLADHRNVEILLDLLQGEEEDCGCNTVARRVGKCREDVHEILRQTPPLPVAVTAWAWREVRQWMVQQYMNVFVWLFRSAGPVGAAGDDGLADGVGGGRAEQAGGA